MHKEELKFPEQSKKKEQRNVHFKNAFGNHRTIQYSSLCGGKQSPAHKWKERRKEKKASVLPEKTGGRLQKQDKAPIIMIFKYALVMEHNTIQNLLQGSSTVQRHHQ